VRIKFDCGHEAEVSETSAKLHSLRKSFSLCAACSPVAGYEGFKTADRRYRAAVNRAKRKGREEE